MIKGIAISIVFCTLFSCSEKNKIPVGIIQQKEMGNILWDVVRAQALAEEITKRDSTIDKPAETKMLTQKVFEIHKIKSSDFDQSYAWYTNHPELMQSIFDSLNVQKRKDDNQLMKEKFEKFKRIKKDSSKTIFKKDD
ncbi:MAG: DUF4296 domain-containing protein [Ginsengibacter sp.]